jgi:hypothetical protein
MRWTGQVARMEDKKWRNQEFCSWGGGGCNKFSCGQVEWGSGGGSPLVRGSAQFANE